MKVFLKLVFSVAIISLFITGCARTSSMQTFDNSHYFQKRVATSQIARAIRDGANRKGWDTRKIRNGLMVATILVRNKYFVAVNIRYNAYGYKISYKNSRNMKYNPADNTIHPSYNKWVRLLQENINYELSNIGMSNASNHEPVAMPARSKKKRAYKKHSGINLNGKTIYIRPLVNYAPRSNVRRNIKEECTLPKALSDNIVKNSLNNGLDVRIKRRIRRNEFQLKVQIEEAVSAGNAFVGHNKFVVISGAITKGKRVYYTFDAARLSGGGYFGAYRSSCSVLGRIAKALGKDVAIWLKNPYDNAKLGDTQLIRK